MRILHHLRWMISDQLIFWGMRLAPQGDEKDDLMATLHPWFQRQVARTRAEVEKLRP